MNENKLKTIAIAYIFSLTYGYGVRSQKEAKELFDEVTIIDPTKVDLTGIEEFEGLSSSEMKLSEKWFVRF